MPLWLEDGTIKSEIKDFKDLVIAFDFQQCTGALVFL